METIMNSVKVLAPVIAVCIGWWATAKFNHVNYKKQKLIEAKLQAFQDYKKEYTDLVVKVGYLVGRIGIIMSLISNEKSIEKIFDEKTVLKELIDEFNLEQERIADMMGNFHKHFYLYENLYSGFSKERIALGFYLIDFTKISFEVVTYLNYLVSDKFEITQEEYEKIKVDCLEKLDIYGEWVGEMAKVYEDFNIIVQNYLYEDITKNTSKAIRLRSDNINYMEQLCNKYKEKINEYDY